MALETIENLKKATIEYDAEGAASWARKAVGEKVAVMPGNLFGQLGEGFVRCSYATAMFDIEEALRRMACFVDRYRNSEQSIN